MMKKYIIANWKANKIPSDVQEWLTSFRTLLEQHTVVQNLITQDKVELIICPSFPYLAQVSQALTGIQGVSVGAQTISSFERGSYTGEVTAEQVAGFATSVIIGHSERRSHFHEAEEDLEKKVELATQYSLRSILCIRGAEDRIYSHATMVAYEPVEAIGSGQNMPAEEVVEKKKTFQGLNESIPFIYGGSVTPESSGTYLATGEIHGLLIGSASLKAESFLAIAATA